MLINFSNHSSANWSEFQKSEAEKMFGNVKDLAFPNIPPRLGEKEIIIAAYEHRDKILEEFSNNISNDEKENAIHLMGEMTFCFALISIMKNSGYKFFASTTERIVNESIAGEKISEFKFVRFREYYSG